MQTWTSVDDRPVPWDCDVVICHRGWVYRGEPYHGGHWEKGIIVSLAQARVRILGSGRIIHAEYWLSSPSFVAWPRRELVPYSLITHWMPFEGFPSAPAMVTDKKEA